MPQLRNVAPSAVIVVGVLALAGCGSSDSITSTTTPATTAAVVAPPEAPTTSTTDDSGPKSLVSGTLLEPGEYVTTLFEPTTVMYRIDRRHFLRPFQAKRATGFQNLLNSSLGESSTVPYTGLGVQSFWRGLTPEEVREKLGEIKQIELGQVTGTEVGGFPGQRIEAVVTNPVALWVAPGRFESELYLYWWVRQGPLDIIILDTPAGTLLITLNAPSEEWDEFLPVANEILAGISFPDMESG